MGTAPQGAGRRHRKGRGDGRREDSVSREALRAVPAGAGFRRAQAGMEAVPRMPMIWLDLKEAGEFAFNAAVKKVGPGNGQLRPTRAPGLARGPCQGRGGRGLGGRGRVGVCEGEGGCWGVPEGGVWGL